MAEEHVAIVGGGLAAATVARELREAGHGGRVTLLSDEQHPPYDRPPLSKQLLAGALNTQDVALFRPGELAELDLELVLGCAATSLDGDARMVHMADGSRHQFTTAVIATGARVRRIDSISALPGVHYLRSLEDSLALAAALRTGGRIVIIGAGFIGLEVAAVAHAIGCAVTVIESAARPLTRVLGADVSDLVTTLHSSHGVDIRCSADVTGVVGGPALEGVVLDGDTVPADLLLIGIGAVPNTEWLAASGVMVDDGVVCDSSGRTSLPGVFAAGDVSRWRNARTGEQRRLEQWQSALEQALVVARVICRPDVACEWDTVPYFWSDQYDRKLQMCGAAGPDVHRRTTARGEVVCFGSGGQLTGVLSVSNPRALAQGRRLIGSVWAEAIAWANQL